MKLLCFPCAGASATMYLHWKHLLPNEVTLLPIELAGRGSRLSEAYINDFDEQIDDLYTRYFVKADWLSQPYVFFGHSMGALLCYGIIKRLAQSNPAKPNMNKDNHHYLPSAVVVSACEAPSKRSPDKFIDLTKQKLIEDLKSKNGTPAVLFEHEDLLDMAVQCLRADYKVCASFEYDFAASLPIPWHVFYGTDDAITQDGLIAWQKETSEPILMHRFEGDHFYLRPMQSETRMIRVLSSILSLYAGRQIIQPSEFYVHY